MPDSVLAPVELSDALVAEMHAALAADDWVLASALAEPLHAADLADLLERLEPDERAALVAVLGPGLTADALAHLDEFVRDQVMMALGPAATGEAVAQLELTDAVDVLSDLDEAGQAAILAALPLPERAAIEQGLAFPEYSAGRLMQRALVAIPDYWTVGQAVDYLRAQPELPDEFYDIFLIDPRFRAVGAVPLSRVLRSRRAVPLSALKLKELRTFPPEADQEEVARAFHRYGLVTAPVVAGDGRLLGQITIDDVVDVIDEEAEDDILKLGGVSEDDTYVPATRTSLRRMPWLVVNLFTAMAGASVIAHFEDTLARLVALAALMPMVAGMAGNAGTQALTVTVRALAAGEITAANGWRAWRKELAVGMLNGLGFLVLGTAFALAWERELSIALVFGGALLVNLVAAAAIGTAVPMVLQRLGQDPAVGSSVFLTPVTDAIGFFVFLGLASLFLL